jgi:hypothetical protein
MAENATLTKLPELPRYTISGNGVASATASDILRNRAAQDQIDALKELVRNGLIKKKE